MVACEEPRETVEGVRLGRGERIHGSVEIPHRGAHGNHGACATGRDERRRAPAHGVGLQQRARNPHSRVEARVRRVADGVPRVAVEDHDHTVVGRVLELLHHELPASRARRPVHAPERLTLLVLAHGVEVEACGSTQENSASVPRRAPGIREQPVERRQARSHDDRHVLGQHSRRDGDEAEEVAEDDSRIGELENAARQRPEIDPAFRQPTVPMHPARACAEPADGQSNRQRAERHPRATPHAEGNPYGIAFDRR